MFTSILYMFALTCTNTTKSDLCPRGAEKIELSIGISRECSLDRTFLEVSYDGKRIATMKNIPGLTQEQQASLWRAMEASWLTPTSASAPLQCEDQTK